MQKFKSMSPAERVASGGSIVFLVVQYTLYLCASIALTVATGVYLWDKEVDNECMAPNDWDDANRDNYIDVSERFRIVLKIFFAYFITEFARALLMLVAALAKSKALANIYQILSLNDCLGLAILIILHVYRFQGSGKACSVDQDFIDHYNEKTGANLSQDDFAKAAGSNLLIERGKYLLGLVIYVWVGGCGLCCLSCIIAGIAAKAAK